MKRRLTYLLVALSLTAFGVLSSCSVSNRTSGLTALRGDWQYYPGKLLYPVDFEEGAPEGAESARLPEIPLRTAVRPSESFGTYFRTIEMESPPETAGAVVPAMGSAYTMWVNGAKVAQAGQVGTTRSEEIPEEHDALAFFPLAVSRVDLVVQLSSFHGDNGSARPILIGTRDAVMSYDTISHGIQWSLAALLVLAFVLSLARFVAQRSRGGRQSFPFDAALILTALLELVAARSLAGFAIAGRSPFPGLGAGLEQFAWLALFPLVFLAARQHVTSRALRLAGAVLAALSGGVAVLLSVVAAAWVSAAETVAGGLFAAAALVAAACAIGRAATRSSKQATADSGAVEPGSGWHAAGLTIVGLGLASDVLAQAGIVPWANVSPAAVFLFALLDGVPLLFADTVRAPLPAGAVQPAGVAPSRSAVWASPLQKEASADLDDAPMLTEQLRKPIQGIVGLAESLLSGVGLPQAHVFSLSLIAANALRLANAVSDIADHERMVAGRLTLTPEATDVEHSVERAVEICRPLRLGRAIQISNDLPRDLPPVLAEGRRLERIVYNLLAEAIRGVEEGSISISAEPRDSVLEIVVAASDPEGDSPGSASQEHETQFPPSIGKLGMSVAEGLISALGGEVTRRSGTDGQAPFAFGFTIPLAPPVQASGEARAEIVEEVIQLDGLELTGTVAPSTTVEDDRSFRILIADDDIVSLQTMRNQLIAEHYRVTATMNGAEALELIASDPPDLVLADAMVPKVGGYEICRAVRKTYAANELPVLIMLDPDERVGIMEGLTVGANDFIMKPIVIDEFMVRVKTHLNLAKINSLYSRFVPIELLHFLGHDNIVELKLGDQIQREMTILFVDIRAFTNLSERMTPQENFKFINSYLSRITPIIRENNGFIDKYIGDAILALYPGSPEDALRSAIRMIEYLHEYNGYRKNSGYRAINIGIGIHTGNLIVGIIGDNERMQGTVISDAVNLASRVQDVTKLYGANIIISQDTFVRLENPTDYNFRFLGKVKVKGKDQTVSLFEVFDGELPDRVALKSKTKQEFEDAILLFSQRKFSEASAAFRRIAALSPDDRAASLFMNRAEWLLKREKASWLLQ
ncbi:MAG TPA: adenylate/guanylate cyclase domain-containing protein [Spirochaetia bacterium]|nr:adenylate/guanylate cyclase domain-containing protein [Spirochaetia bacterium]